MTKRTNPTRRSSAKKQDRDDWARGYFCAVALYIKENCAEGNADSAAISMFRGALLYVRYADEEDKTVFVTHGLMPAEIPAPSGPAHKEYDQAPTP
ncbi:MAG: hypothetical protein JSR30_00185 [Proteobacteria bacterium]|nr:hypothetical protein [Pseudomonadota bacterium]